MTWPEVALAAINGVQVIALAWIAGAAHRMRKEVELTADEVLLVRQDVASLTNGADHGLDRT